MAVTIHRPLAVAGLFTLSMALAACSALRPPVDSVLESVPLPTQWYAPMYSMTSPSIASTTPHHNRTQESPPSSTAALIAWWEGFNDPLLVEWIRQAQAISPTIASAKARIESARATAVQTTTALFPTVAGTAQRSRSVTDRGSPTVDRLQSGFTLSWEIGVWGQSYAYFDGARANFEGSQATWHEARVLVAAEVAQRYFALRFCAPQLTLAREDQESRALTARQLASLAGAGFASPADHALANASAAEGVSRYAQQHARCESLNKSMVALTGIAEPELRVAVNKAESTSPIRADATLAPLVSVSAIPALTLAQRPDVYRAHRTLITAGANVGVARAALLPSISLQGTITHQRQLIYRLGSNDLMSSRQKGIKHLTLSFDFFKC
jgi:multidrug efflux system outer membrane protein